MNESLRCALVDFLNLQGYALYPAARIDIIEEGCLDFYNPGADVQHVRLDMQDVFQFLLEYTVV